MTTTTTYMQNRKTGEIHRLVDGMSKEECNLDAARDSGSLNVLEEADALREVAAAPNHKCGHCWPEAAAAAAEAEAGGANGNHA